MAEVDIFKTFGDKIRNAVSTSEKLTLLHELAQYSEVEEFYEGLYQSSIVEFAEYNFALYCDVISEKFGKEMQPSYDLLMALLDIFTPQENKMIMRDYYLYAGLLYQIMETCNLVAVSLLTDMEFDISDDFIIKLFRLQLMFSFSCPDLAKAVILSEKGENLIMLLNYPNSYVRKSVIDVIGLAAKKSHDVCQFFDKKRIDEKIVEKLHIYIDMCEEENAFSISQEVNALLWLLLRVLETKKNLRHWRMLKTTKEVLDSVKKHGHWKVINQCEAVIANCYEREHRDENKKTYGTRPYLVSYNSILQHYTEPVPVTRRVYNNVTESESLRMGTKLDVVRDQYHEFVPTTDVNALKEYTVAKMICGLLNNNKPGSLILGLNQNSIVEGVVLTREEKDTFRNAVDIILRRAIKPEVQNANYNIIFTAVMENEQRLFGPFQKRKYVIEIQLKPIMHVIYTLYPVHRCFVRKGLESEEMTLYQREQQILKEEDESFKKKFTQLIDETENDVQLLALFEAMREKIKNY